MFWPTLSSIRLCSQMCSNCDADVTNILSSIFPLSHSLIKSLFVIVLFCASLIFRAAVEFPAVTMSTISPTDFDSVEIQQQYNDINNRWDIAAETEWDNENSSARLFERSRIKALAGQFHFFIPMCVSWGLVFAPMCFLCLCFCLFACFLLYLLVFNRLHHVIVSSRGWHKAM